MTSEADRVALLQLAREAIVAHVSGQRLADRLRDGIFAREGGAFVTLHARGDLRGCIGHIVADEALGAIVPRCAIAACSDDPRFPPVAAGELTDIEIEISLLGLLEPIDGPAQIEIGRHGLVVELGWHRGLLLPQVAVEWKWNAEAFLAQTCHKAGLSRDAWRHGAKLWRFEAEVFGEEK